MTRNSYKPVYGAIREQLALETEKRAGRHYEEWILAERLSVQREVNRQRALLAYAPVGVEAIEKAESSALGHSDYLSQYAHAAADVVFRKDG